MEKSINIFNVLKRLWFKFPSNRKGQSFLLLILMYISSFAEIFSILAVLPFLSVLINPEKLFNIKAIKYFADFFKISESSDLLVPITLTFISLVFLSAFIKLINLYLNARFAALIGNEFGCKVYKIILYEPYSVHIQRNSSKVISTTTTYVNCLMTVIQQILTFITSMLSIFVIIGGLIIINYKIAFSLFLIFALTYSVAIKFTKNKIKFISNYNAEGIQLLIKNIQEGLGAIRDIILDNTYNFHIERFKKINLQLRMNEAKLTLLGNFPRFALEGFGISFISILALTLTKYGNNTYGVIPLLGALALSAQKLMPAFQTAFASWANVSSNLKAVSNVIDILDGSHPNNSVYRIPDLNFKSSIEIKNLYFKYKKNSPYVLENLNFKINKGEKIGIIGTTGSGKSTLLDNLMGLIEPTKGLILIDNNELYNKFDPQYLIYWKSIIAHVPQTIYLSDQSIMENIAIGFKKNQIDMKRIKEAAKKAQILDFINKTEYKFETKVGENGVQLSGGQRQRIGIARALYKNAQILILDEATSALDNATEASCMKSIIEMNSDLTIIIIAHRLTTVEKCDRLVHLENGLIKNIGLPKKIISGL